MHKHAEFFGKTKFSELVFDAKWVSNDWAYADTVEVGGHKEKGYWFEYKVSDTSLGLLKYAELFVSDKHPDQIAEIRWLAPHGGRAPPSNVHAIHDPDATIMDLSGISLDLKTFVKEVTTSVPSDRYSYLVSLMDGATRIDGGTLNDQGIEIGEGGKAIVDGHGGDDTVWIWHDKDVLFDGGKGSDTIAFGDQQGGDLAQPSSGVTVFLSDGTMVNPFGGTIAFKHVENVVGWHDATNKLIGDDQDNVLTSGNFSDTLRGMDGNDTISIGTFSGHGPRDLIADGGAGRDTLEFWSTKGEVNTFDVAHRAHDTGAFADSTFGKFEIYRALGPTDGFIFRGGDASEEVYGSTSSFTNHTSDSFYGGGGNDVLDGGAGADKMVGGTGDDTYYVSDHDDIVKEKPGEGTDSVIAAISQQGVYTIPVNVENVTTTGWALNVIGNALDNHIENNGADNFIDGRGGDDVIFGDWGSDTLTGGTGADQFVYKDFVDSHMAIGLDFSDKITDFDGGEGDKIDLSAIDADENSPGKQKFDFIDSAEFSGHAGELRVHTENGDTVIEADGNGDKTADMTIRLQNAPTLVEGDFIL